MALPEPDWDQMIRDATAWQTDTQWPFKGPESLYPTPEKAPKGRRSSILPQTQLYQPSIPHPDVNAIAKHYKMANNDHLLVTRQELEEYKKFMSSETLPDTTAVKLLMPNKKDVRRYVAKWKKFFDMQFNHAMKFYKPNYNWWGENREEAYLDRVNDYYPWPKHVMRQYLYDPWIKECEDEYALTQHLPMDWKEENFINSYNKLPDQYKVLNL